MLKYSTVLAAFACLFSGPAKGSTVLCFPLQMSASSSAESLDKCREELQELMQLQRLGTFSVALRGVVCLCVCVCQGDVEINGNKNHISQWHRQFARSLEESYQNVQVDPGIQGHVCF